MSEPTVSRAVLIAALVISVGVGCRGNKTTDVDKAWQQVHANPTSAQALVKLGKAYEAEGKNNEAFLHFRQAWNIDSTSFEAAYQLAHTAMRLNDPHSGLTWIDQALEINGQSATAWELKGRLHMTSGNPRKAISLLKEALQLDPELGVARLNLVAAYKAIGEIEAAVRAGADAVEMLPEQAPAHFAYADALEAAGQDQQAEHYFREAMQLDPDLAAAKLRLSQLLTRKGKYLEEAYKLAQAAHKLEPGDGTAEATAGWALFLMGEEANGLNTIQNAARAHPFLQVSTPPHRSRPGNAVQQRGRR